MAFDRAILFLADDKRRELRAIASVGPLDEAEAEQLRKTGKTVKLSVDELLGSYEKDRQSDATGALIQRMTSVSIPVTASAPPLSNGDENVPVQALLAQGTSMKTPFFSNNLRAVFQPPAGSGGAVMQFSPVASIPLCSKDSVLGILLVDNSFTSRPFDDDDVAGLLTLGNLAVIAIENNRLKARLDEMAKLDGLTGVFNRRYFESRLEDDVDRARKAGRALALLVFHINGFKECNEKHGFEAGDKVLVDLASFLRKGVRAEDLIARYGKEEFLVMLTGGATMDESRIVAEKLISQVPGLSFGGLPPDSITLSCGVAWLPSKRLEKSELSRMAAEVLEMAKKGSGSSVFLREPADQQG
jgi:diguanylate cyclase (GGDEF)-like protein